MRWLQRGVAVWLLLSLGLAPAGLWAGESDEAEGEGEGAPVVTVRHEQHMATRVSISVARPESPAVLAAIAAAFAEVARIERQLSKWRADSQIAEINRRAGKGPVAVGPELFRMAELARDISAASGGAFDVTFAALDGLWDFDARAPRLPDEDAVAARVARIDYRKLVLDAKQRTLRLAEAGMRMGLGGIAKGYAVDRASRVLRRAGFGDHLVVAGGDLYAAGRRGDRPWRIGVRHPRDRSIHAVLEAADQGVATSGNYERFFSIGDKRYHHLIDPRTGWPARGVSSVTVVAPDATRADGYATALFVLGVDDGLELAEQQGLEVLYFDADFATHRSQGLRLEAVDAAPTPTE